MESRHKSIMMFPWLAHGHISPFLELAKHLTQRNFHIYFCSTPINFSSIKKSLPEEYSLSIQIVELHLPSLPELPPHFHTTNGLPPQLMSTLKKAFDMASPNFAKLLRTLKPDLLIYDSLQPWAPSLASSLNIPAVLFFTINASVSCLFSHLGKKPDLSFPFPEISNQNCEVSDLNKWLENPENNIERLSLCADRSSKIILIKTFREIEEKYIDYLSHLHEKEIVPVGLLVQDLADDRSHQNKEIIEWLEKKQDSSVVFVSFGSEYFLSKEELEEIAHGLELSDVNFLWVIRFPVGEKVDTKQKLPKGFHEIVGEKGMVVQNWVPQAKILGHRSVGGFVSHCGWSSVMESIYFGIPIIAVPMHLDQPMNSRLVSNIGIGVEVRRTENGKLDRENTAEVIREVVVEKKREGIKRKVNEMRDLLRSKGDKEIDYVVEELVKLHGNNKAQDLLYNYLV